MLKKVYIVHRHDKLGSIIASIHETYEGAQEFANKKTEEYDKLPPSSTYGVPTFNVRNHQLKP